MTMIPPFSRVSMIGPDILMIFFVPSDSISSFEKKDSFDEPSFFRTICPVSIVGSLKALFISSGIIFKKSSNPETLVLTYFFIPVL